MFQAVIVFLLSITTLFGSSLTSWHDLTIGAVIGLNLAWLLDSLNKSKLQDKSAKEFFKILATILGFLTFFIALIRWLCNF